VALEGFHQPFDFGVEEYLFGKKRSGPLTERILIFILNPPQGSLLMLFLLLLLKMMVRTYVCPGL
jgi:hypothetical protein